MPIVPLNAQHGAAACYRGFNLVGWDLGPSAVGMVGRRGEAEKWTKSGLKGIGF